MHSRWLLGIALSAAFAAPAAAQYPTQYADRETSRTSDPCAPPPITTNALLALAGALTQQRHDTACLAFRRAQWASYNAQQEAKRRETADALALAQTQRIQAEAQAAAKSAEVSRRAEIAHAKSQQTHARAAERARAQREARLAADARDSRLEDNRRRTQYVALITAERAAGNVCRHPEIARSMMQQWSALDAMKAESLKAIDIEHVTTTAYDSETGRITCHGVFVTNQGLRLIGSASARKNIAGDPIFAWSRDARQDLSLYDAPSAPDANAPEMQVGISQPASEVTVTRVMATTTAPKL